MEIQTSIITLKSNFILPNKPEYLRGYIGNTFKENTIFHQHDSESLIYSYPLVRYCILLGEGIIIGYGEGSDILTKIYPKLNLISMGNKNYTIFDKSIKLTFEKFGINHEYKRYRFITPWLALSQKNYIKFQNSNIREKNDLLKKIIVGNILSSAKGLRYTVPEIIKIKLNRFNPVKCFLKNTPILGLLGCFEVNFHFPELFGLGKSVSRGFGMVESLGRVD